MGDVTHPQTGFFAVFLSLAHTPTQTKNGNKMTECLLLPQSSSPPSSTSPSYPVVPAYLEALRLGPRGAIEADNRSLGNALGGEQLVIHIVLPAHFVVVFSRA